MSVTSDVPNQMRDWELCYEVLETIETGNANDIPGVVTHILATDDRANDAEMPAKVAYQMWLLTNAGIIISEFDQMRLGNVTDYSLLEYYQAICAGEHYYHWWDGTGRARTDKVGLLITYGGQEFLAMWRKGKEIQQPDGWWHRVRSLPFSALMQVLQREVVANFPTIKEFAQYVS